MSATPIYYTARSVAAGLVSLLLSVAAQAVVAEMNLVPQPAELQEQAGAFLIPEGASIYADSVFQSESALLRNRLQAGTGLPLPETADLGTATIRLLSGTPARTGGEAYDLDVTPGGITLRSATPVGMFRATQTLLQLLPAAVMGTSTSPVAWYVPCVRIRDAARFPWRGLMLDCSRTFQSVDYLKKTIDRMAVYKMNVLHLHLTDDQGWRMEIKSHPELTDMGSKFSARYNEPASHEGFYTQEEMRGLVQYASVRGITIVPEIELPGHSAALMACHPELACTGITISGLIWPFHRGPTGTDGPASALWNSQNVFCAGNDASFHLLEDILEEVIEIFPSEFIHIGGDEVSKANWSQCARCQARIQTEHMANTDELQSYFVRRIETYINTKGRRLMGWSEIMQGGLAPNAAVMDWIGGGAAAAQAGHDVVMSPTTHCYFDYSYGLINSALVFDFDPLAGISADSSPHVLGLQANFWSHIDREPALVDRQLFPRLMALAERGWSPDNRGAYTDYKRRARAQLPRLEALGVSYQTLDLLEAEGVWAFRNFLDETKVGSRCWVFKNSAAPVAPIVTAGELTSVTPVATQLDGLPDLTITGANHAGLSGYEWTGDPDKPARDAFSNGSGFYTTATMNIRIPPSIATEGRLYRMEILALAYPDPAWPDRRFNVAVNGVPLIQNWQVLLAGNYNSVFEFDIQANASGIALTLDKGTDAGVDTNPYVHAIAITPIPTPAEVYASWAQQQITALNPEALAAFGDDPDGDGVGNGLEWILGGHPLSHDAAGLVTSSRVGDSYVLTFKRTEDSIGQADLSVEWDTDLTGGFSRSVPIAMNIPPDGANPAVAINTTAQPDEIAVAIPFTQAAGGKIFARIKAVLP